MNAINAVHRFRRGIRPNGGASNGPRRPESYGSERGATNVGAVVVGVNVTLMAQFEPAATGELVEHVVPLVATAKSPLAARALISSGAVPEFATVTDCGALVVPTSWPLNVRLAVESLIAACAPVPA